MKDWKEFDRLQKWDEKTLEDMINYKTQFRSKAILIVNRIWNFAVNRIWNFVFERGGDKTLKARYHPAKCI